MSIQFLLLPFSNNVTLPRCPPIIVRYLFTYLHVHTYVHTYMHINHHNPELHSSSKKSSKMEQPNNSSAPKKKPKTKSFHTFSYFTPWEIFVMFGNIVTFVVVRLYESFFTSRHDAMVWKVFQRRRPDPRDSGREYVKAIKYVLKTSDSTHMALRCRFFCNERFGEFLALLHLVLRALDTVGE